MAGIRSAFQAFRATFQTIRREGVSGLMSRLQGVSNTNETPATNQTESQDTSLPPEQLAASMAKMRDAIARANEVLDRMGGAAARPEPSTFASSLVPEALSDTSLDTQTDITDTSDANSGSDTPAAAESSDDTSMPVGSEEDTPAAESADMSDNVTTEGADAAAGTTEAASEDLEIPAGAEVGAEAAEEAAALPKASFLTGSKASIESSVLVGMLVNSDLEDVSYFTGLLNRSPGGSSLNYRKEFSKAAREQAGKLAKTPLKQMDKLEAKAEKKGLDHEVLTEKKNKVQAQIDRLNAFADAVDARNEVLTVDDYKDVQKMIDKHGGKESALGVAEQAAQLSSELFDKMKELEQQAAERYEYTLKKGKEKSKTLDKLNAQIAITSHRAGALIALSNALRLG